MTLEIIQSDYQMAEKYRRGIGGRYQREVDSMAFDFALARIAGWNAAVEKASIAPELDLASGNSVMISDAIRNLRIDQEGKDDE